MNEAIGISIVAILMFIAGFMLGRIFTLWGCQNEE